MTSLPARIASSVAAASRSDGAAARRQLLDVAQLVFSAALLEEFSRGVVTLGWLGQDPLGDRPIERRLVPALEEIDQVRRREDQPPLFVPPHAAKVTDWSGERAPCREPPGAAPAVSAV
jgi:hypothetical protein